MQSINLNNAITQKVILPDTNNNVEVYLQREDLIHPFISGNKYYKLKYNLEKAKEENKDTVLTFGGAYSNHIHAVSAAAKLFGFKSIGIIRGEEYKPLNPTLQFAVDNGMKLYYLDRKTYRNRTEKSFREEIAKQFGDVYILPEGGTNELALKGTGEILQNIKTDFDYLCVPVGSGGTLAGLITGLYDSKKAIGFSSLKGGEYLSGTISELISNSSIRKFDNWIINHDYHFGGFAKISRELIEFVNWFKDNNNIQLDLIYNGKMMFGINDMISKKYFTSNSRIVAIHTGGLQGLTGMKSMIEKIFSTKQEAQHSSYSII
ncbi:1-aminocyclopropane-1-carboxylate deaminase [hydrocarbon metagenome]|uniref:1-aminocyclopropane-1-carboxylate deaminase n=1 Tax=hydrocarbon metagenome TaxID=938273 RepID=A0A0W8FZI6_9ZZZZ